VTLHPDPPFLRAGATTELEVRHRPLLVGATDAALRLESPELGLYEWGLRLAGTAVNPERALTFSVPLGGREAQVFRFTHFLAERTEYRVGFRSTTGATGGSGGGAAGGGGRRSSVAADGGGGGKGEGAGGAGFDAVAAITAPPATGPGGFGGWWGVVAQSGGEGGRRGRRCA